MHLISQVESRGRRAVQAVRAAGGRDTAHAARVLRGARVAAAHAA